MPMGGSIATHSNRYSDAQRTEGSAVALTERLRTFARRLLSRRRRVGEADPYAAQRKPEKLNPGIGGGTASGGGGG